jgi:signal recognition particle receptor subunit beta
MAVFNYLRKEIDAKIVYYGPGISGKTTNLQYIHEHLKQDQRGKMVSLATDEDRTLFFDFLPIELESVRGFKTRFHLYTVPGQVYYGATRRAVVTGADGVIFVADSQADRLEDNLLSLKDLEENLRYYGKKLEATPLILQYNKRDLPNVLPVEELNQKINRQNVPYFEAAAILGKGVFETLTMICRLVLKAIEAGVEARRSPGASDTSPETPTPGTPRMEAGIPAPEAPRSIPEAAPVRAPRVEKSPPRPESPRAIPGPAPARELRLEKDEALSKAGRSIPEAAPVRGVPRVEKGIPRPESPRGIPDLAVGPKGLQLEKDLTPPASPRPARIPPIPGVKPKEEISPAGGRTALGRPFDKKMPEPPLRAEGGLDKKIPAAKDKLRILSCGQPRVSPPSGLEIPLTLEIEGVGKTLSFNLAIKLEQLDPKVH